MRDPERWTCSRRKTIFISTWRTHGRHSLSLPSTTPLYLFYTAVLGLDNGYLSWVLEVEAQPFPTKSSTISTQRAARLSRPPRTLPASRSTPRIGSDEIVAKMKESRESFGVCLKG
ncbi:hypothetical protein FOVG_06839 [Fusarium oxysporum f. sp. pisi HDV247]|uniref:Uncharacterized protein n=1 Tax=Fusarium oxysporum f. sp. pisi HDV247 TaxID=1080344 RepID=W9PLF4_FUSOX|nr:hypothetical protein FOVG_06839 [Fusarium oxysporum f. sp. pisi HDV247]